MTGNQPDQQICEIFFLCLDLIKKRDLSCVAFLHSSERNALESYEKYPLSALQHACRQTKKQGTSWHCCFTSSAQHGTSPAHQGEDEENTSTLFISFSPSTHFFTRNWGEETYGHLPLVTPAISKVITLAECCMFCSILYVAKQFGMVQMPWIWCLVVVLWIKTQGN